MTLRLPALFALLACAGGGDSSTAPETGGGLVPSQGIDSLQVPAGLRVTKFATVSGARVLSVGPDGALYVTQTGAGRIMRLLDVDNDGVAESQTVAVSGLDGPHGVAWRGDTLYIANARALVRVRVVNGVAAGAPQQLATFSGNGGHSTRSVVIGRDNKVYVSIGSSCNLCVEANNDRAAVMQYNLDGSNGRRYASGLRNAVGMAVHPTTGEIWVSTHERDNIQPSHEDLPPEEIDILEDGGDFGWPYCHSNRVPNPEYANQARCNTTVPPALVMQAHSAPLGVTFLVNATKLPASMRGDMLVAFHGSWNRTVPTGAKVVRVQVVNNRPTGYIDFLAGFQRANGSRWGRPTDVAVWKDGSVLVSEDLGGGIYRVGTP